MDKFLFYTDIRQFLTEEEQMQFDSQNNNEFSALVKAFWQRKPNMSYEPGVDDRKTIYSRMLNVEFFNVPADVADTIIDGNGLTPSKEYRTSDGDHYNLVYNCRKFGDTSDRLWNRVAKVIKILEGNGFKMPDLQKMANNIPNEQTVDAVEKQSKEKWMDIVRELGNGKTDGLVQKFVQIFGKVYQYVYGHKLSFKNARLILSQNPNATLVLTAPDWEKYFDCTVNDDAKPILYYAPMSNRKRVERDYNKVKGAADAKGVAFDKSREHSSHSYLGFAIDASDRMDNFIPVYGYDTVDVTPNDPNDDKRVTTLGMVNNLTGEPNEMTREYLDKLYPKDGMDKEYNYLRNLINDNAKLYYRILVQNLQKNPETEELGRRYGAMGNPKNNPDFSKLLPNIVEKMVDKELEETYKIAKPADRAPSKKRITGELLFMCGVWDASALASMQGGTVDEETLVHDSNIVNKYMTLLDAGRKDVLDRMKSAVDSVSIDNKENTEGQEPVNENIINEQVYCTPEKLAKDFNLTIVPSNGDTMTNAEFNQKRDETKAEMYEMLERMNNLNKPLYRY